MPLRAEDGSGPAGVPVREQGAEAGLAGGGEEPDPAVGRRDYSAQALVRVAQVQLVLKFGRGCLVCRVNLHPFGFVHSVLSQGATEVRFAE